MEKEKAQAEVLQFIFTEKDFFLDIQTVQTPEETDAGEVDGVTVGALGAAGTGQKNRRPESWKIRFETDRYHALYQMGFEQKMENLTASGGFLHLLSDLFFKRLTSLPELELVREKVKLKPSSEDVETLLKAVPFAIGAEYIDVRWISGIFRKLLEIFRREIAVYNGTVEMYLTEKNQHLHVPERIFFHLVEHKDSDFPFAFLATYATRDKDGQEDHLRSAGEAGEYRLRVSFQKADRSLSESSGGYGTED